MECIKNLVHQPFIIGCLVLALCACQDSKNSESPDNPGDTETDTKTDTDTNTNTDTDTNTDTNTDTDTDTNTDTNTGTDADTESDSVTDTGTGGLTFGYPVYTRAEIDAWSTDSPEYTRLASSWAGNVNRPHTSYGTEISSVERDVLKDESGYMKVQAVLWAADANDERRAKVAAMLDELRSVTSWQTDPGEQYRLVAGWACTNLAQAAAIIGYMDPDFTSFLVDVCYPILDWSNGPNWHASFADSRLAIAAYAGDPDLWEDAMAYFNLRIAQSIYHSSYDSNTVSPLLDSNETPQVGLTKLHWGEGVGACQINDDFTPANPMLFPDGVNAERMRDLGHVSMGLGAFMHAARTVLAQGEILEPHAYDRLREAYAHHGNRVLVYLQTGVIPDPNTIQGDGGGALKQGWFGARKLFGVDTPADVVTLCAHPEITGFSAAGANHLVAEGFADEY
ncbi:MAG: hypothetical protein JXR91_09755 [Deltaproteobacteria bacterium]|nr:hypothetical protein [Deltaproteobacteria bacterium]